ncbi:hypothetical protein C8R43DRAFT_1128715 [Mycena crocata]|nr:hypothetical protein C8R43DRAFT_1128715 [Mycena crocata]
MALRPGHNPNCGKPDKSKTIRAKGAVAEDKKAKADEQRQAEEACGQVITTAAAIENCVDNEDALRHANVNRPPPTTLTKTLRPWPEKTATGDNEATDGAVADPCSDGTESSNDFNPDQVGQPASDSNEDMLDASEEETGKAAKRVRKKKVGKGSVRQAVDAQR